MLKILKLYLITILRTSFYLVYTTRIAGNKARTLIDLRALS